MKKIHVVLLFILVILVSCATSLAYLRLIDKAPDNVPSVEHVWTTADSATVETMIDAALWPTFLTVEDVENYYNDESNYRMKDSIFFSIPLEKLKTVAQVTIGKFDNQPVTIEDIILEYLRHHQDIYQYIANRPEQLQGLQDPPKLSSDTIYSSESKKDSI